jgi:hypothetical protein
MRKLALAVVVGLLLGAGAAAALATARTTAHTVARAADPLSAGSPSHPQGVKLAVTLGWLTPDPATQPLVTKLDLWFPRGSQFNGARFPTCSVRVLDSAGPAGCPKASIMGRGIGDAYADTVITHPTFTVVNGGSSVVYFYTVLNNPARVQEPVVAHITRLRSAFTYHLSVTIPNNLLLVAGVPIRLTSLRITAGRGDWLAITAPPAGIKVVTTFNNGASDSTLVEVQNS